MILSRFFRSALAVWALLWTSSVFAQFEYAWQPGFELPGIDGSVTAMVEYDDGFGPVVLMAGNFFHAGTLLSPNIISYAGGQWQSFGNGVGTSTGGWVNAMTLYNDGAGNKVCVAGSFTSFGGVPANNIACWNGFAWTALGAGTNNTIYALLAHDHGNGPRLYAAGSFSQAGGAPANRIAYWNGSAWSAVGTGVNGGIYTLSACFGTQICAGGGFSQAGGNPAFNIASWTGTTWTNPGNGVNGVVVKLRQAVVSGQNRLIAGGNFTQASGRNPAYGIASTSTGGQWFGLGEGFDGSVTDFLTFNDGSGTGTVLYAVGGFEQTRENVVVNNIARLLGTGWEPVGEGLSDGGQSLLVSSIDGTPALYVGGYFNTADDVGAASIAKYSQAGWSALSTGNGMRHRGQSFRPGAMLVHDGGQGPVLFVGGAFDGAGPTNAKNLATWDGAAWSTLGAGNGQFGNTCTACNPFIESMALFDEGFGPSLFVGGSFFNFSPIYLSNIARWNAPTWSGLQFGLNSSVYATAVFDDGSGPMLYAGGSFDAASGVPAQSLARWTGTQWLAVPGLVVEVPVYPFVYALEVFDDGTGPALYVAGRLKSVGGLPAANIARWDGQAWSALGDGVNHANPTLLDSAPDVFALKVFDDGNGPKLYAAGAFSQAGGMPASMIASWDGTQWQALDAGLLGCTGYDCPEPYLRDLEVFDDGHGPALYAAGRFTLPGSTQKRSLARWNGTTWFADCFDIDGPVDALGVFDDGTGTALHMMGQFTTVNGTSSSGFAIWGPGFQLRGDCDGNSGIGLSDWAQLAVALAGPEAVALPCDCLDITKDGMIALRDAADWMNIYTGPATTP